MTDYNAKAVISEYQLLRWTIFDVLKRNGIRLDLAEFAMVNALIDGAIEDAVVAFTLAESAIRERVIAMLTHDLRNPLAAANIRAELILQGDNPLKMKEMVSGIKCSLNRLDEMIMDMLDAAVFHSGERLKLNLSRFDIGALAGDVCHELSSIGSASIELNGPAVVGNWDRKALRRVIENLLNNAMKYGRPASPIHLDISAEYERLSLTVHNEGTPIPREEMESIFQVFNRAAAAKEGRQQGWGIGLPYVRSVAESHGGSIVASSGAESGTTFGINIPLDATPFQDSLTLAAESQNLLNNEPVIFRSPFGK